MGHNITHDVDHYEIGAHNITHDVDHYEIGAEHQWEGDRVEVGAGDRVEVGAGERLEVGAGERLEVGAGERLEIGGPSIAEDAFPQDVSLGADTSLGVESDESIGAAVKQVIKTARDSRQPAPKMRAVDVDAPDVYDDGLPEWFADVAVGCGEMIGAANPFPLMTRLMTRFGASQEKPRIVRVDTEASYEGFRAVGSTERASLQQAINEVAARLDAHLADPHAHEVGWVMAAVDDAEYVGGEALSAEEQKTIDMWLPEWAKGKIQAWREGEFICASVCLPGADGELRICTSMMPAAKAIEEMGDHAAASGVSVGEIAGVLPAMGCVLGAGTLVKEMAAAAPAILQRSEAAEAKPFMVRIEPRANPALCAFVALLQMCSAGDEQACSEWNVLAEAAGRSAPPARQAMEEAKALFLKAQE